MDFPSKVKEADIKAHIPMFSCYLKHQGNQEDKSCSSVWKSSEVSITTLLFHLITAGTAGSWLKFSYLTTACSSLATDLLSPSNDYTCIVY